MDPLSISVSCINLITTIAQVSVAVTNFVREVRDARGDLDAISRELVSLKFVLELLAEDTEGSHSSTIPERLKDQILDILKNCRHVVTDVEALLRKHSVSRLGRAGHWAVGGGKGDMTKFRSSLETHKTALGLALDMVAITISRDIKDDTQELLKDAAAIKDDTALILEKIAQLQDQLPRSVMKDTSNHMLHRYLDDLSNSTELMSNATEDEPETSRIVNSEDENEEENEDKDEDETASSPDSVPKDPDVSRRRPSSLLSKMYTGLSGTSTAPEHAPIQTGAPDTKTIEQTFATRQEDDSPQPRQNSKQHPIPRSSSTIPKNDEPPPFRRSSEMSPIPPSKPKPTTKDQSPPPRFQQSVTMPSVPDSKFKPTTRDESPPPQFQRGLTMPSTPHSEQGPTARNRSPPPQFHRSVTMPSVPYSKSKPTTRDESPPPQFHRYSHAYRTPSKPNRTAEDNGPSRFEKGSTMPRALFPDQKPTTKDDHAASPSPQFIRDSYLPSIPAFDPAPSPAITPSAPQRSTEEAYMATWLDAQERWLRGGSRKEQDLKLTASKRPRKKRRPVGLFTLFGA